MALTLAQRRAASKATQSIYDTLVARGLSSTLAQRVAAGLLQRPGTTLTASGQIKYNGRTFTPAAFADTPLARLLSGERASTLNQAAITGDPGYLQTRAQLDFQKQQNIAALDQQRQQAIRDYGVGSYTDDPTLAAQANANPFSITKLLAQAYARARQATSEQANRAGTLFGGGYTSGMNEQGRINAQQETEANRSLVDLLGNLNQQYGAQNQAYQLGLGQASLDAQQRLLAAGLLHAAQPGAYTPTGHYHFTGLAPPVRPGGRPAPPGSWHGTTDGAGPRLTGPPRRPPRPRPPVLY